MFSFLLRRTLAGLSLSETLWVWANCGEKWPWTPYNAADWNVMAGFKEVVKLTKKSDKLDMTDIPASSQAVWKITLLPEESPAGITGDCPVVEPGPGKDATDMAVGVHRHPSRGVHPSLALHHGPMALHPGPMALHHGPMAFPHGPMALHHGPMGLPHGSQPRLALHQGSGHVCLFDRFDQWLPSLCILTMFLLFTLHTREPSVSSIHPDLLNQLWNRNIIHRSGSLKHWVTVCHTGELWHASISQLLTTLEPKPGPGAYIYLFLHLVELVEPFTDSNVIL